MQRHAAPIILMERLAFIDVSMQHSYKVVVVQHPIRAGSPVAGLRRWKPCHGIDTEQQHLCNHLQQLVQTVAALCVLGARLDHKGGLVHCHPWKQIPRGIWYSITHNNAQEVRGQSPVDGGWSVVKMHARAGKPAGPGLRGVQCACLDSKRCNRGMVHVSIKELSVSRPPKLCPTIVAIWLQLLQNVTSNEHPQRRYSSNEHAVTQSKGLCYPLQLGGWADWVR